MSHQANVGINVGIKGPAIGPTEVTVIVVIGGDRLDPNAVAAAPAGAFVIAADSGLDHALVAGLRPDLVVGDFDSVSAAGLAWAHAHDVPTEEHPPDKDSTDTELALAKALAMGAADIVMLGGGGDRLDHSLGAITALGHASLSACRSVSAHWDDTLVHVLHGPRTHSLAVPIGATFSLLALHGRCAGVRVDGAQWPLDDAVIQPGSGLGVSNVGVASPVTVSVAAGTLTVIIPRHFAPIASPVTKSVITNPVITTPVITTPVITKPDEGQS